MKTRILTTTIASALLALAVASVFGADETITGNLAVEGNSNDSAVLTLGGVSGVPTFSLGIFDDGGSAAHSRECNHLL